MTDKNIIEDFQKQLHEYLMFMYAQGNRDALVNLRTVVMQSIVGFEPEENTMEEPRPVIDAQQLIDVLTAQIEATDEEIKKFEQFKNGVQAFFEQNLSVLED